MHSKEWIVVADPHLNGEGGDVEAMIELIEHLDPINQSLLFLGDLFHIWAGPKKFHTPPVEALLAALWGFKEKGGVSHLVGGNRDAFLSPQGGRASKHLPFEVIALDFDSIDTPEGLILAHHGDLVNQEDEAYLKWRKVMSSWWFRGCFELMPGLVAKKIMFRLEEKLKGTNRSFKVQFPQEQWEQFVQEVAQAQAPRLLLVGHFHPRDVIETTVGSTQALVVPGWLETHQFVIIHRDLSYETLDSLV